MKVPPMNPSREQMLRRIREAVLEGNRAGDNSPTIPERGQVGYQGAGDDPVARFREEFAIAGGRLHVVAKPSAAAEIVLDLVRARSIRRVLLGEGEVLDALALVESLQAAGCEVLKVGTAADREARFQAEMGLTGVDYLIAETGSIVLASRTDQPRSLSLLPPLHIAVAQRRQILPDLFDVFTASGASVDDLPSCLSIITGPSKTGDIELRLVTGVHGPGEVHVILIE